MSGKYYRDLVAVLRQHGCTFVRSGKGDHEIWYSPITNKNFPIDRGGENRHTANRTLRFAGIDEKL